MGKKILLVDDAPIIRLMLGDILREAGYDVVGEAGNGVEALKLYGELKPDLVTLDIVMPEMDGIQTIKELLNVDPDAKVIMVTAIDQKESLVEAIKNGASDYIVKPFENSRVISAVKNILGE